MLGATLYVGGWTLRNDASLQLSLDLPAGLSYTSASGVFLTSVVPEPPCWALWSAGLALLLALSARAARQPLR